MNWYLMALKRYAVFSERSRRKEYWFFALFYLLLFIVAIFLDSMLGMMSDGTGVGVISAVFGLAMIVPSLAVTVRRLHDTSRSGWWVLVGAVPFVGGIILLVFACQDSTPGTNAYGPNPKGA